MPTALFINDYSFHGQFATPEEVVDAVKRIRSLHAICGEYSIACFCSRSLLSSREAVGQTPLRDVVLKFPNVNERRLILSWLDKHGPYWDTERLHDASVWYFAAHGDTDTLVTDSAVAECAEHILSQRRAGLLSAMPSNFMFTPVIAGTRDDTGVTSTCELPNYWKETPLRKFLADSNSVSNWAELLDHATQRFSKLAFGEDAFAPLMRTPFSVGLRDRIIQLFKILNQISAEIDAHTGALTNDGEALREAFFVGGKALFTDSSDSEKQTFKSGLTFTCPVMNESQMFPWHGKAKMGDQYRIHFGWPKPDPNRGLPVVYIGPKITKR